MSKSLLVVATLFGSLLSVEAANACGGCGGGAGRGTGGRTYTTASMSNMSMASMLAVSRSTASETIAVKQPTDPHAGMTMPAAEAGETWQKNETCSVGKSSEATGAVTTGSAAGHAAMTRSTPSASPCPACKH
jgi:hypothetical protein